MQMPNYHLYVTAIAQRNLLILFVLSAVMSSVCVLYFVNVFKPNWRQHALWIETIAFWATLGVVVVFWSAWI